MNISRYKLFFKKISDNNLLVALTGGIGSGKSTALSFFCKYGCYTISADEKVKKILTNKKNCDKILIRYPEVSDRFGFLDKKKLALLIFKDKRVRNFVEGLIHPKVVSEILREIKNLKGRIIVVEIPLLFESGLEEVFDITVSVVADRRIRVTRLIKRGMRVSDIRRRIKVQKNWNIKLKRSDMFLFNNGSVQELEKRVKETADLFKKIMK